MPISLTKKQRIKKMVHVVFPVSRHLLPDGPSPGTKPNTLAILHVLEKRGIDIFSRIRLRFGQATCRAQGNALCDTCPLGKSSDTWVVGGCITRS